MEELEEAEAYLHTALHNMNLVSYPYKKRILKRVADYYEKRDQLITFAKFPDLNIPKTSNLIEGMNSTTFELRLSSIRGFQNEQSAEDYINALILKRRFQKFTDCKNKFKHLNGRSPLKISNPLHILPSHKDWIDFCLNLGQKVPK